MNNKDSDQTVRMRRLICIFVFCIWHKQVFTWHGSYVSDNKEAVLLVIDRNTPMVDDALKELDEVGGTVLQ